MPNYKELYAKLFRSQTKAIHLLQEAKQVTEDMFIEAKEPDIRMLSTLKSEDKSDSEPPDGEK